MKIDSIISIDVLVIGAGGAALRAALEASDSNASVIVACKGQVGKCGATVSPDAPSVAWQMADTCVPDDSTEIFAQNIVETGLGMVDPQLANILAEEAIPRARDLERLGMHFITEPDNPYVHYTGYSCFGNRKRAHGIRNSGYGHAGDVVKVLHEHLLNRENVSFHENVFIVDLVVAEGRCLGAVALSPNNRAVLYSAGAIVIATGGASQVFPHAEGRTIIDTTGDGYAMGYRAGAILTNMEFMQYMIHCVKPFGVETPGVFWALHPEILNRRGENILKKYLPPDVDPDDAMRLRTLHYPFSTRDNSKWIDIAIASETQNGMCNDDGTMSLRFTRAHHTTGDFSRPQHHPEDFSKVPLIADIPHRVQIFAHAVNGGLLINEKAETSVSGLFSAGESATGSHGADRLGGAMIVGGQVFGARAGYYAAKHSKENGQIADETVKAAEHILEQLNQKTNGSRDDPDRAIRKVQLLMKDKMTVIRQAIDMLDIISELNNIKHHIVANVSAGAQNRLIKRKLEAENIVLTAEMMVKAALSRKESRGGHYRADYPSIDQKWEKNIFISKGELGMNIEAHSICK